MEKDAYIAGMITIGYFFSMLPQGTLVVNFDNKPFKLSNTQFYYNHKLVPIQSSKLLNKAGFLPLYLRPKNSVKGRHISHGHSTSTSLCPLAVAHQKAPCSSHKTKPHQSLCSYCHTESSSHCYLVSQGITQILCAVALHFQHSCVNPASVEYYLFCTCGSIGVPSPLLQPWNGLTKPKSPTHKKYLITNLLQILSGTARRNTIHHKNVEKKVCTPSKTKKLSTGEKLLRAMLNYVAKKELNFTAQKIAFLFHGVELLASA